MDIENSDNEANMLQPRTMAAKSRIIRAVYSPLGFFVLALLIVESFLWGTGVFFNLPDYWKIMALSAGIFLFLVVFGTVVWLVVKYPKNLVFSEESHVQYAAMNIYGNESKVISGDALNKIGTNVRPEPTLGQITENSGSQQK